MCSSDLDPRAPTARCRFCHPPPLRAGPSPTAPHAIGRASTLLALNSYTFSHFFAILCTKRRRVAKKGEGLRPLDPRRRAAAVISAARRESPTTGRARKSHPRPPLAGEESGPQMTVPACPRTAPSSCTHRRSSNCRKLATRKLGTCVHPASHTHPDQSYWIITRNNNVPQRHAIIPTDMRGAP